MRHELIVQTIRIAMVSLLALTWVVLTSHCRIEAVPGFEFLRCASETASSSEGGDPCEDAGCCVVETTQFHAPRHQEIAPVLVFTPLPSAPFDVCESTALDLREGCSSSSPPGLSAIWQFFERAALPPRAPSLRS